MAKKPRSDNVVCRNRKAAHRFEILEKLECGIALKGSEVKSLRDRSASIEEAYVRIDDGELWLIGCHIPPYKHATTQNHEPTRRRKLLAHAREIARLQQRVDQKGMTLVPVAIYFNARGLAKVTIGVARGKGKADRREDMKARDHEREIKRAMGPRR